MAWRIVAPRRAVVYETRWGRRALGGRKGLPRIWAVARRERRSRRKPRPFEAGSVWVPMGLADQRANQGSAVDGAVERGSLHASERARASAGQRGAELRLE